MKWNNILGSHGEANLQVAPPKKPLTWEESYILVLKRQAIERKALIEDLESTREARAEAIVNRLQILAFDYTNMKGN